MRANRTLRLLSAGAALVLLVSCGTRVPLPPLPPLPPLYPARLAAPASAPVIPGAPATDPSGAYPPAETSPISSSPVFSFPPLAPAVVAPPPDPASAPYGDAVAARFPDPPVSYNTPAFEPGHPGYTTNAELHDFMQDLANRPGGGTTVQLINLGPSQRGVSIEALLFTRAFDGSPTSLLNSGRPTVVLTGQQHGDEPASSEALMVIAQRLGGGELQTVLDRINVIVLPRANPDGAEANTRVTAGGIDANRDHLLLRTPEAQAMAVLMRDYQPMVVVDAHEYTVVGRYLEKFGAVQRFDALVQYAMTGNMPEFITKASEEWFREPMLAALQGQKLTTEWYYTTSSDIADKKISMGGTQPDTARNINGLRNAVSILIETRGVGIGRLHLKRRVHTHVTAITSVLRSTAQRAADLHKLRGYVDAEVASRACQGTAVLDAQPTPSEYRLLMLDPATGADKPLQVTWDSALELRTMKTRARPCGYWLSADASDAVTRLRGLGVTVQQLTEPGVVQGDAYTETSRQQAPRQDVRGTIADSSPALRVAVQLRPALMDVPSGSYYIGLDQPLASLVIAALEPDTQNSYLANGIIPAVDRQARVTARPNLQLMPVP